MIQVFKTSVKTKADARKLTPLLNNFLQDNKWNFDLADCDKNSTRRCYSGNL